MNNHNIHRIAKCIVARQDTESARQVYALAKKIAAWFKTQIQADTLGEYAIQHRQGWLFPIRLIDSGYPDLYLLLGQKDSSIRGGFSDKPGKKVVVLNMLDDRGLGNPYLHNWLMGGYETDLLHELTHYFTARQNQGKGRNTKALEKWTQADRDAYFMLPDEWQSYWQETAAQLVNYATYPAIKDKMLEGWATFLKIAKQRLSDEFLAALTPEMHEKLMKRLYMLYQALRDENQQISVAAARKDWEVSLECLCADDFGAGFKDEDDLTEEDIAHIENYEETRNAHARLAELASTAGIRRNIQDTDDRDSRHSDAYLYFRWSQLSVILKLLEESGVPGDILDVPKGFPASYREKAESLGWTVEQPWTPGG